MPLAKDQGVHRAPQMAGMGVGQDNEVNGGRLDAGGLASGRETACGGLRPASGVDEHTPVSGVHQNDIDLGPEGLGTEYGLPSRIPSARPPRGLWRATGWAT
jgi:hypothetical protein